MVTAMTAPALPRVERQFRAFGFPFTSEMAVADFLKAIPEPVLKALEVITRQVETEILKPLLYAPDFEELGKEFTRLFAPFSDLQNSMFFLIYGVLTNVSDFFLLSASALDIFKRDLESRGSETIGEVATNDALLALRIMNLVTRRIAKIVEAGHSIDAEERDLQQFRNRITACSVANLCVWYYLSQSEGRQENVRVLAYWSRHHAAGVYRFAKALRVVEVPTSIGEIPQPDEEDLRLAEAGLEDFVTRLAQEEEIGR